jgi:hypothetical protein
VVVLSMTLVPAPAVPAPGQAGPLNLSSVYNVNGIAADGVPFSNLGLDNDGYSYSATQLGTSQTVGAVAFNIGPVGAPDVVTSTTVPLPSGQFGTLQMLATGVNGNQPAQTFTVNYTDGTQSTFNQSLSDWYTPQGYPGEATAVTTAYRNSSAGTLDHHPLLLYAYSFQLASGKSVSSIVLPSNRNVVVLAITLTN